MTVAGATGPDPAALYAVYTAAASAADIANRNWAEARMAGGTSGVYGYAFSALYQADQAVAAAWVAWQEAREQ